jgi:hypothetical protein
MFMFRTAIVAAVAIMLMPTEEPGTATLTASPGAAAGRTTTFCERNPSSCAAGAELWATFVKKSEVAFALGVKYVAEQIVKPGDRGAAAPLAISPAVSRSSAPIRETPPASPQPRTQPARGTLTAQDSTPAWRGPPARTAAQ